MSAIAKRDLEKQLKALANVRRLAILSHLKRNKEASVGEISSEIGLSFKATSKHLGILAALDVVERDQRSLQMYYRLSSQHPGAIARILPLL
jgi:DNA-binding transcriptional ArsR family regulator